MIESPLAERIAFTLGPLAVSETVVVTWGVMAVLALGSWAVTRRLALVPGRGQAALELVVTALDAQILSTLAGDPGRVRALIGTLLLFVLTCNWSSLIPGVEPPTAHLETDAALALIVFLTTIGFGIRAQGLWGWLRAFARPTWAMIPLNLVEQVTRSVSLMLRLFGNVMSGVFVLGIVLSLAGLLVPIPLMALDLLTGAVQAYIFAILALVFIASAVETAPQRDRPVTPETVQIASILGAAFAVGIGSLGPALGEGRAVAAAMEAIARQPEAAGTLSRTLFVGLAMIETMAIYCLVIALLLLFANPFTG
ncbi:F0F1 ATP synthase subunit A (plasmid) [Cereibacter sphaeroides]|nr:F0F1 ATP synthase subunit A [Cereibacter sphaeroides]